MDPGTKPAATSQDDWDKLERRERSTIWLCLLDSVLLNIFGEDNAVKLWEKLGCLYQSNPVGQVVSTKEVVSPQNRWKWNCNREFECL